MKTIHFLLIIILAFPFTTAMASGRPVVLTADQVSSAADIEAAIATATSDGTRPGRVILDGSKGEFVYTGDDKTINLFYSKVSLRGQNGAVISNCDDGVYFDDVRLSQIVIEGITFICQGNGIAGAAKGAAYDRVFIRRNVIQAQGNGIEIGAMKNWHILMNTITAGNFAIHITGGQGSQVSKNKLSGFIGVYLHNAEGTSPSKVKVHTNEVYATWQGVLLGTNVDNNKVQSNRIIGVQSSGIAFEGENERNTVTGNRVACAAGFDCLVVDAYPEAYQTNKIRANTFFQPSASSSFDEEN